METVPIREAKASFSALAVDGARLSPLEMRNLPNYLLTLPEALETERDNTPLQGTDFEDGA